MDRVVNNAVMVLLPIVSAILFEYWSLAQVLAILFVCSIDTGIGSAFSHIFFGNI